MNQASSSSRFRSHAVAAAAGLGLLLASPLSGWARPLVLECESLAGGGWALLIETEAGGRPSATTRPDGAISVEIADPDPSGWEMGARTCRQVAGTSVVPGSLLGEATSHVIVKPLRRSGAPRVVEAAGRVRLLWLPAGEASPAAESEPPADPAPAARPERSDNPPPMAPLQPTPTPAPEKPHGATEPEMAPVRTTPAASAQKPPEAVQPKPAPSRPSAPPAASVPVLSVPPTTRFPASAAAAPPAVTRLSPPETLQASLATEVRSGPGRRESVMRRIAGGEAVTADGRSGDWLRLSGGGWVFAPYFTSAASQPEFMATVSAEKAQVRSGPGAQHDLVAEVFKGESVAIDDVRGDWAHVRNGGWVLLSTITR